MYVCARCNNMFRMYCEDEERHTETCPHCGSEYFDHYSDEDLFDCEEEEEECEDDECAEEGDDAQAIGFCWDWDDPDEDLDEEYSYNYDND